MVKLEFYWKSVMLYLVNFDDSSNWINWMQHNKKYIETEDEDIYEKKLYVLMNI